MHLPHVGTLALLAHAFFHVTEACACSLAGQNQKYRKRDVAIGNYTKTAITNVRVFDGHRISEPETVIIDGELIGTADVQVDNIYDAGGRILIPGLMDGHAHPPDEYSLQNLTAYGVTTVFNMACSNYTLCQQMKNMHGLTSYITAGVPAQGPGSCHATNQHTPPDRLFYGPDQAPSSVAYTFGNGSDFYKITAEVNGPSLESQIDIIRITHDLGKQTMTHASIMEAYEQAVASRTDGIQHVPLDGLINATIAQTIVAQNQTVTPTMYIAQAGLDYPGVLAIIGCGANDTNSPQAWEQVVDGVMQNARTLYENGVTLIAGTDSVGDVGNMTVPMGSSLHQELQNLVAIGMSPAEALRAATIVPATFHRLPDRGVIAPGMRADLVLLNSDPLVNISNTLDLEKVWVGGLEYPAVAKLC